MGIEIKVIHVKREREEQDYDLLGLEQFDPWNPCIPPEIPYG